MSKELDQIYGLIPKVMASIGAVGKDRKNEQQGYKFRGIEDIYNAAHPALIAAGVFCVPQVLECTSQDRLTTNAQGQQKSSIRVTMRVCHKFYAPDGSFVDVITCGEGIDSSDKATNKAMSAAMKYAFVELLSLPFAEVEDADKDSPESGARKLASVPRTTEDIPIAKANGKEPEDKRELPPDSAMITSEQAKKLHIRFRESLREDLRKNADALLYDYLGSKMYLDAAGNPSASAITAAEFASVGKAAIAWAKELS